MQTNIASPQLADREIDEFLHGLLRDADVDGVSEQTKNQMIEDLRDRLEDRFAAAIIEHLDEQGLTTFRTLIEDENADPAKVEDFITTHVQNSGQVFAEAMHMFRDDYLGITH